MLRFILCTKHLEGARFLPLLLFIAHTATAQNSEQGSTTILPSGVASDIATTTTVDFSSALHLAASVAPEIAMNNFSNPVPIPTDAPDYGQVSLIAGLFPPRQQSVGTPDLNAFAEIQATSNSSNQVHKRQGVMRVMVVGDSMTHCHEGDYTWRYRIWDWFRSQNVAVDMVGPYLGTQQPDTPGPPAVPPLYGSKTPEGPLRVSGTYAANFDSSHFAISGRAAAVVQGQIQGVTADYPADLMLVMLGFNDLGWFYSDDNGLVASMTNLITNARRSNPNMMFVIGTVPHRTFIGGRQDLVINTDSYNRMLKAQGPGWSTATSPVVVAPVREEYDCGPQYSPDCPAAWDGLHPNELGEYQIARAYSRALVSGLGIGRTPLAVPANIPPRPLPIPQNLQISPSPLGLTATWDQVYGAYGYDVDYNINGGAALYEFSPGSTRANRWDSQWALDGWTYQLRIRATAGNRKGEWTGWVSGTAKPQTASTANLVAHATATGFDISWGAPTGAYSDSVFLHNVYYWDIDTPCTFLTSGAFSGGSGHIDNLIPGRRYFIAVEAWNSAGAGFPAISKSIVAGGGTPGAPQNLQIQALSPTTSHLTWDAVAGAGGYNLFSRNVNQAGSTFVSAGSKDGGPCVDVAYLFPGTWNYEWAVSAYNGADSGTRGPAQLSPSQSDGTSGSTCPVIAKAGCSGGGGPPATDPIDPSDPVPPGTSPGTPDPTCISGSCQPCSGSSCQGCTGSCTGCSGSGCNGCRGPECSSCQGLGCIGCKSASCTSCTGRDCGLDAGPSGGRLGCRGPLCTTCIGSGCEGCNGPSCTTCKGSDCDGKEQSCSGDDCSICSGSDCDDCKGSHCESCKGKDCDGRTSGCNGHDCDFCEGADCHGCHSAFCETCFGLNCLGCLGPLCTICRGSGCDNGDNSCSGANCPTTVPPPVGPPPGPEPEPTNTEPSTTTSRSTTSSSSSSTVAQFCPTPEPTDPSNYDDGSDDSFPEGPIGVTVTTLYPPTGIVSGTNYPFPAGGTIVIGGSTLTAPTGTLAVTDTVGSGTVITLLPARSAPSISITISSITVIATSTRTAPWTTPTRDPDFRCKCDATGCSADSLPCCATGTCTCDCNENLCAPNNPLCCASGTCKNGQTPVSSNPCPADCEPFTTTDGTVVCRCP